MTSDPWLHCPRCARWLEPGTAQKRRIETALVGEIPSFVLDWIDGLRRAGRCARCMTKPFSLRLEIGALGRLERLARRRGLPPATIGAAYVDEGTRMELHPGVEFRSTPADGQPSFVALDCKCGWPWMRSGILAV